jgi:hypothetical protein
MKQPERKVIVHLRINGDVIPLAVSQIEYARLQRAVDKAGRVTDFAIDAIYWQPNAEP